MRKFLMGFRHAGRGVAAGMRGQRNIKVMLVLAGAAAALGWYRGLSRLEWAVIVLCIGLVLALELLNTAGERLVDILCPDHDPRYGLVKDIMAAAVLVAAAAAALVGALVFLD